ncbi:hypothetical protein AL464_25095 [Vibrio parahaemolyticus]|nr:hypothetical protein AL464_25095 [Vibrio parahaemolyticus]OOE27590.1 hypothetical protein BS100_15635 [Vibrio parahaemolyticus]
MWFLRSNTKRWFNHNLNVHTFSSKGVRLHPFSLSGFLDFWIFGFLDFWIFGFLDFWIFGFL